MKMTEDNEKQKAKAKGTGQIETLADGIFAIAMTLQVLTIQIPKIPDEREMDFKQLKKAESILLRILKEGYLEQTKSWSSDDFIDLYDDKGGISWDPHLVPMGEK